MSDTVKKNETKKPQGWGSWLADKVEYGYNYTVNEFAQFFGSVPAAAMNLASYPIKIGEFLIKLPFKGFTKAWTEAGETQTSIFETSETVDYAITDFVNSIQTYKTVGQIAEDDERYASEMFKKMRERNKKSDQQLQNKIDKDKHSSILDEGFTTVDPKTGKKQTINLRKEMEKFDAEFKELEKSHPEIEKRFQEFKKKFDGSSKGEQKKQGTLSPKNEKPSDISFTPQTY